MGMAAHALEAKQDVQWLRPRSRPRARHYQTRATGNRQSQTQGFVHAYTPANFILPEG